MASWFKGETFMVLVTALYVLGALASLYEGKVKEASYHASAALLTLSVLWLQA